MVKSGRFRRTGYTRPWFRRVRRVVTNIAESKYVDTQFLNQTQLATGGNALSFSLMNNILQGTTSDASTRVGNRIFVKGIWCAVRIIPNPALLADSGMLTPTFCRIAVVKNMEGVSGLVNPFNLWRVNGAASATGSWASAFRNSQYFKQFRVLSDRVHQMSPGATSSTSILSGPGGVATWYIPINAQFNYKASTATAGNFAYGGVDVLSNTCVQTNNVLGEDFQVIMIADGDDVNCCSIQFSWKVIFKDF